MVNLNDLANDLEDFDCRSDEEKQEYLTEKEIIEKIELKVKEEEKEV